MLSSSENELCPQNVTAGSIACTEGMLGDDPEAKAEFEELAKQEMEVWKSMVSGAAVMEHMEDRYHDMLKVSCWL